jgi:hypothetical protein
MEEVMRTSVAAVFGLCAIALAGCGGRRAVEINPQEEMASASRWNATLATPAEMAGATQIRGRGWMGADPKDSAKTEASVAITNAAPGGVHPWHVHIGRCGADQGILGPPEAYEPLKVNKQGRADATAELQLPVPRSGEYFVNVHASASNMKTIIACGNLAPPVR